MPRNLASEVFENLIKTPSVRIERIVSKGHVTPAGEWYDQDENEWVLVLQGEGMLEFNDGEQIVLKAGDYLDIPARRRHRVVATSADPVTVWLAVFYR